MGERRVGEARLVIELGEDDQLRLGEDLLHEQRLAPSGMGEDDVRIDVVLLQRDQPAGHRLAIEQVGIQPGDVLMRPAGRLAGEVVDDPVHVRQRDRLLLRDEVDLVLFVLGERLANILELPGHVLMDEDNDGH